MKKLLYFLLCVASVSASAQMARNPLLIKAENGNAISQFNLGYCFDRGSCSGIPQNKEEAIKWYTKSAEQGFEKAQNNLALLLMKSDPEKAVYWFKESAEQGNQKAQYNLANSYKKGRGVVKNDSLAVYWYTKAAERGHEESQYILGNSYRKGDGVVQNDYLASF